MIYHVHTEMRQSLICGVEFLVCPTNNYVMETGPWFKVSSETLEEPEIEPATPGLQD